MSRRWRYPRPRRGVFYQILTTLTTPYIPSFQEPSGRNSRSRITRRGQFYRITPTGVTQVAQYIPTITEQAGRNSRPRATRRGRFYAVAPAPIVAVAVWVPPFLAGRRSPVRPIRRGEYLIVPPSPQSPPACRRTRRATSHPSRRGRYYAVPPFSVLPGPGPLSPSVQRPTSRRLVGPRRGRFFTVPQQMVQPTWVPLITRARRRPSAGPGRRGEFLAIPLQFAACPPRATPRRAVPLLARRGQTWRPPWTYVPPAGPGPYIPRMITSPHRPPLRPARRGVYNSPPWTGAALSCKTRRPDMGVTSRPSTGVTTRPEAGVTARPCILT